jgi:hypothetical protein
MSRSVLELLEKGHAAGPFDSPPTANFKSSPLGVAWRARNPGKLRVINHLSWPRDTSVNDGIPDSEASIQYDRFERAIEDLLQSGPGTRMAKLDLKDAFRHIPVAAADQPLLGFAWEGKFYISKFLHTYITLGSQGTLHSPIAKQGSIWIP